MLSLFAILMCLGTMPSAEDYGERSYSIPSDISVYSPHTKKNKKKKKSLEKNHALNRSYTELSDSADSFSPKTCRILTLDGGGARGIMELFFLQKLEEHLGPLTEQFHMIGGTSVGGIGASLLALPNSLESWGPKYSADFLLHYMKTNVHRMFERRFWSFGGFFGPKYHTPRAMMDSMVGNALHTDALTDTVVMTYDLGLSLAKPIFSFETQEVFKLKDVLLATSAAPTYFSPQFIYPVNHAHHPGYFLGDGGMCANDPTLSVLSCAKNRYPHADQFQIVSLGTGKCPKLLQYDDIQSAGLIGWGKQLPHLLIDGQATHTQDIIRTFKDVDYSRWNPVLQESQMDLDNTTFQNIDNLITTARGYMYEKSEEFSRLISLLTPPKDDLQALSNPPFLF